jgi:hypothetical protein
MGCARDTVVQILATVLDGCSEVVISNISCGFDHDLIPLSNCEINPISRIRFDGDEVVGDDGKVVIV